MREKFTNSKYSETWIEDGIIFQVMNQDYSKVDLDMAKQLILDRKIVGENQARPVLVDVGNVINTDKEVKEYYRTEEPYINIKAIAIVTDNFVALAVGSIVFKLKKNPVPVEFFNSRLKGKKWLDGFK